MNIFYDAKFFLRLVIYNHATKPLESIRLALSTNVFFIRNQLGSISKINK